MDNFSLFVSVCLWLCVCARVYVVVSWSARVCRGMNIISWCVPSLCDALMGRRAKYFTVEDKRLAKRAHKARHAETAR